MVFLKHLHNKQFGTLIHNISTKNGIQHVWFQKAVQEKDKFSL